MTAILKLAYRVPEALEATGMKRTTLLNLIARGEIKVKRIGRIMLIPRGELERWLAE